MKSTAEPIYGIINSVSELGKIVRGFRKHRQLTLEKVSGITNISMRFLSELERGKETAEIGKALAAMNQLGLEVIIQPRGYNKPIPEVLKRNKQQ